MKQSSRSFTSTVLGFQARVNQFSKYTAYFFIYGVAQKECNTCDQQFQENEEQNEKFVRIIIV